MGIMVFLFASFAAATAMALGALLVGVTVRERDNPRHARVIGWLAVGFLTLQAVLWAIAGSGLGQWQ